MNHRLFRFGLLAGSIALLCVGCNRAKPSTPLVSSPTQESPPPAIHEPNPKLAGAPQPLPAELIQAWEKAGAEYGWLRVHRQFGTILFVDRREGRSGDIPGFHFVTHDRRRPIPIQWKDGVLAALPSPAMSFGLVISGPTTPNEALAGVQKFKTLEALALRFTPQVTGEGLLQLKGLPKLKFLDLGGYRGVEISNDVLHALRELRMLHQCPLAKGKDGAIPEDSAAITSFTLQGDKLTEASIQELQDLPNLEHVSFSGRLSAAGVDGFTRLGHLRTITLLGKEIQDDELKELKRLKDLQALRVVGTLLTDRGLAELGEMENLQSLILFPNQFTKDGLEHLKKLKRLKKLWIGNSPHITDRVLDELRSAMPGCEITSGILPPK